MISPNSLEILTISPANVEKEEISKNTASEFKYLRNFYVFDYGKQTQSKFKVEIPSLLKSEVDCLSAFFNYHKTTIPFFWDGCRFGAIQDWRLLAVHDGRQEYILPNRYIDPNSFALGRDNGISVAEITGTSYSLNPEAGIVFLNTSDTITVSHGVTIKYANKYKVVLDTENIKFNYIGKELYRTTFELKEKF